MMKKITVKTKDDQTLIIVAIAAEGITPTNMHTPDNFHILAFLGKETKDNMILSCNCDYMRKDKYIDNPFCILDSISDFWAETAIQMFIDRKCKVGHILLASWYPFDYTINKNILFAEGFDLPALLRGMLSVVSLFYTPDISPDYFIFCGNPDENPDDEEWDEVLSRIGAVRYGCENASCVDETCYIYRFTR